MVKHILIVIQPVNPFLTFHLHGNKISSYYHFSINYINTDIIMFIYEPITRSDELYTKIKSGYSRHVYAAV
jgi:hypothetical protein